jgi:amino acid adenylation domain-containing protein
MRIDERILRVARSVPDRIAIEATDGRWSYAELSETVLRIATGLRRRMTEPGEAIGIADDGYGVTVSALLGIWRAGGIAVPLSYGTSPARLAELLASSRIRLVIAVSAQTRSVARLLAQMDPTPNCLAIEMLAAEGPVASPPGLPDDRRAYIFWTSGSTGDPKGVIGRHAALDAYVDWQVRALGVEQDEGFSNVAPLNFDFALKEILVPLAAGAKLCPLPPALRRNPEAMLDWIAVRGITTFCTMPTMLRMLTALLRTDPARVDCLTTVRTILISGEQLSWSDVAAWRSVAGGQALFNLYGPTESTVIKFWYRIPEITRAAGNVPVGKPIDGADLELRGRAEDGSGEVVILSDDITEGYCGADQGGFHVTATSAGPIRAFATGDIGRLGEDGDLTLLGRKDRVVKLRGHRVSLDEVEACFRAHPGLSQVAAVVRSIDGHDTLICYCANRDSGPDVSELRAFGRLHLPEVAIPSRFARLEALPLSDNGKIDRKVLAAMALPSPGTGNRGDDGLAGRLAAILGEVLDLSPIPANANFFELGGNSISAIRLLGRLRREVSPHFTLEDVYRYPTPAALTERLAVLDDGVIAPRVPQ